MASAAAAVLAGCAATGGEGHQSGRLARVSPAEFAGFKPEHIAAGVELDSRVPAELNRGVELVAAVVPIDHDAWEPIGARLPMRPLNLLAEATDPAAGKALRAWLESPPGRMRLAYVLVDEAREELAALQARFRQLLEQHPPGSGRGGALRIRVDMYRMLPPNPAAFGASRMQTWLQLDLAEGPFVAWDGRIAEMR